MRFFLFTVLPALWNAEPIPPGSTENKKTFKLCVLCVFAVRQFFAIKNAKITNKRLRWGIK